MRLLNTKTYELQEFVESQIPEYVILSHRWGEGEVTYKEFRKGQNRDGAGYEKIMQCCAFARSKVREWVWIDTCCIDKRSSAELSEAINSMWKWYKNARECYAYLGDVPSLAYGRDAVMRRLHTSDWFTRGWTLQELLAPESVLFCNRAWEIIGSKDSLACEVSAATHIPERYIQFGVPAAWSSYDRLQDVTVAERMSWASRRQTLRDEDRAYCLLGLFDVNMPLLYGEGGARAYTRLQLEIIGQSNDETIFAWSAFPLRDSCIKSSTMIAHSPVAFAHSNTMRRTFPPEFGTSLFDGYEDRTPYTMTNRGFHFPANARRKIDGSSVTLPDGTYAVELNCYEDASPHRYIVLLLAVSLTGRSHRRIYQHATPDAISELIRCCQWEDAGLMHFYVG